MEEPYLFIEQLVRVRAYNRNYGDHRICKCGHSYWSHFRHDGSYTPDICSECNCYVFMEKKEEEDKTKRRFGYLI